MGDCRLVMIEWEDSAQPMPSWAYLVSLDATKAVRCVSVGWLIHDGDDVKGSRPEHGEPKRRMQRAGFRGDPDTHSLHFARGRA